MSGGVSGGVRARAAIAFERGEPLRIEEITVRDPGPGEVRVRSRRLRDLRQRSPRVAHAARGSGFPPFWATRRRASSRRSAAERERGLGGAALWFWPGFRAAESVAPAVRAEPILCAAMRTDGDDGSLRLGGDEPRPLHERRRPVGTRGRGRARGDPRAGRELSLRSVCPIGCGVMTGFGAATIDGCRPLGRERRRLRLRRVGLSAIQGCSHRRLPVGSSASIRTPPGSSSRSRLGATDVVSPEDGRSGCRRSTRSARGRRRPGDRVGRKCCRRPPGLRCHRPGRPRRGRGAHEL